MKKSSANMKKEIQSVVNSTMKQKLRNQTVKWLDNATANTVSSTGTFVKISTLAPGNTNGTRLGNKVHMLKLVARGTMVGADVTNVVRVIFFKWNMNDNSDAPGTSEILTASTDPVSNLVPLKPSRFKVLHDQIFHFDVSHVIRNFSLSKKLDYDITYDPGTNGGVGQLYYLILSDSGSVPHPAYDINAQIQYVDSD